jgi:threonine/homoserine/homoserine lactone efflux protein
MFMEYNRLFFWALVISFLGTLPIGTLNVTVTSLTINKGTIEAMEFAMGAILVETILVRMAVVAIKKLEGLKYLLRVFSVFTCIVLISFALIVLYAAFQMRKFEAALPFTVERPFMSGICLSLLNPLHLPFWMGWTALLKSKKIFRDSNIHYNTYVAGIGLGTALGFLVYGIAGNMAIDFLKEKQVILNWIVGFALLATGLRQCYKTFGPDHKKIANRNRELEYN